MSDRRDDKNRWEQENRRKLQDVGELPAVVDPGRKNRGLDSLESFARDYFPTRFYLPPSAAHLEAVRELEAVTNDGGQAAVGMPRGFGKTSWAEVAVLRAVLYGLRRYVLLVAATERHAGRSLKRLQTELETNDLLLADFPEACVPIRKLERNPLRAKMQTYRGVPTRIEWTAEGVILPHVPGAACAGAAMHVAGLTAALRGLQILGPDGQPVRPDMVLLDDVQTRESARSPTQTVDREAIVTDDVLMLAGPTTKIAAVMLCTVIQPGDLSDRFLDPDRHPEWRRVRTKTVVSMPSNLDVWDAYAERRRLALAERNEARVNADYRKHRTELEAGAAVSWAERVKDGDVSALQSAMHVYLDNPRGFHAELQNDPKMPAVGAGFKELVPAQVAARLSGTERLLVPRECARLTAGFDCSPRFVHWFTVVAWTERGGGTVIGYGAWPNQSRSHFAAEDARPSLADQYPKRTEAERVYAGLADLLPHVLGRTYFREGGGELQVERALVDAGDNAGAVYEAVRSSQFGGTLHPSKGIARSLTSRGIIAWKPRPGERRGPFWRLTAGEHGNTRQVQYDPDETKTVVHQLLTVPVGGGTALTLYGKSSAAHEMFAEHTAAETSQPATAHGTVFDKWTQRPHRPDNHLWDTLILAAVAASVAGLRWTPTGKPAERKKVEPIDLGEEQRKRRSESRDNGGR